MSNIVYKLFKSFVEVNIFSIFHNLSHWIGCILTVFKGKKIIAITLNYTSKFFETLIVAEDFKPKKNTSMILK